MTLKRWKSRIVAPVLAALLLPLAAHSFSLTATNIRGAVAYSPVGGAAGIIGMANPQINSLLGGSAMGYNSALLIAFDFSIVPTYPTPYDLQSAPDKQWKWSLRAHDFQLPTLFGNFALPDLHLGANASYNQVLAGAAWAQNGLSNLFDGNFACGFATQMTSATTGVGYLALAGDINGSWLPGRGYIPFYCNINGGNGAIDLSVTEAVPEPFTMLLFGSGLAGMGLVRYRNRKKATK